MKKFLLPTVALILLIIGVMISRIPYASPQTDKPNVIVETLDPSLVPYENLWRDEVARRFNHAIVIECHGGDFQANQWIMLAGWTPWKHVVAAEEVIAHYQVLYPDRTMVLISCNPGHIALHGHPNVYYAHSSVWVVPDRMVTKELIESGTARLKMDFSFDKLQTTLDPSASRSDQFPDVIGNIYEFISAK